MLHDACSVIQFFEQMWESVMPWEKLDMKINFLINIMKKQKQPPEVFYEKKCS